MSDSFMTAVLCIDGRYRRCLVDWLIDRYGADYVDLVTEPGPGRALGDDPLGDAAHSVRRRLDVSIRAHASQPSRLWATTIALATQWHPTFTTSSSSLPPAFCATGTQTYGSWPCSSTPTAACTWSTMRRPVR